MNKVLSELDLELLPEVGPRYNIAPTQRVLVFKQGSNGPEASQMQWGFLPAWSTDPTKALINARAETAADKPTFREAFRERRCLLPADGFYEWKKAGRKKEPFFIQRSDGKPFAFAGVWEQWRGIDTCAILTTTANSLLAPLHERMPVIIDQEHQQRWLDPQTNLAELESLLVPYPDDQLTCQPVSTRVNSAASDDPACLDPPAQENLLF